MKTLRQNGPASTRRWSPTSWFILCAAASFAPVAGAFAAEGADIHAKVQVCGGCHGADGMSQAPGVPNLAGQKERYLVGALKAYRDGGRNNPMMRSQAKDLSDAEIEELASHFSGLKPK